MGAARLLFVLMVSFVVGSAPLWAADYTLLDQTQLSTQAERQFSGKELSGNLAPNRVMGGLHKYAGYATVLLAGITAVSSSSEDFHENAAYGTVFAALATVGSGLFEHRDRLDLRAGLFAEDNRHILAGAVGSLLMVSAVALCDGGNEGSHSAFGIAGGVLMGLAVIDIKW